MKQLRSILLSLIAVTALSFVLVHHRMREESREREGKAETDDPQEFARILAGMRIPADRTTPEYEPGYQLAELERATAAWNRVPHLDTILPWAERGPGNVAGRARGIVVDPDDATHNTWFIASVGGGIWKTTNGGATWSWLTPNFPVLSTSAIAMAASDHNVLYAGTGESFFSVDVINGNGILKSVDRGATWTMLASTLNNPAFQNISRIIINPTNPNIVLASTSMSRYKDSVSPRSSIMRSIDGGLNWTEVFASTTIGSGGRVKKILQIIANPINFNTQYATIDEGGILLSTNAGVTWALNNSGITDFSGRFEIAMSPVTPTILYALAEGASHSELYKNTLTGGPWFKTTESGGSDPNWLGTQGWYDNTIVCHPTDLNTVYLGGIYLWKVVVSGTTRTSTFLGTGTHPDNHGLSIINAPGGWRILNTSDGGVAVSTLNDGGWYQTVDGMVTTQFYGADKRPGASAYLGGTQDNGTWQSPIDPGSSAGWTHVIGGDGYEAAWDFDDPTKLIGGYQYNGLMRSLDGGLSWESAQTAVSPPGVIDNGGGNAPFITKIASTHANPDFLCAVGRRGVWRSTDFGGTWSLYAIPAGSWGAISSFHCIRISRADSNVVWGGSAMSGSVQMFRSTDAGVSFSGVPNYTTVTMGGISGLATHPTDPNTAYVLFSFGGRPKILRTTNGGTTWSDITGFGGGAPSTNGFPDVAVYDLEVFSDDPNHMWAATEIGLVESLDGGTSWALANNGLPNVGVWQLVESEDQIVAATHGRGIWSVTIPSLVAGITFKPLVEKLFQGPSGTLTADFNLRSVYDSTQVIVDSVAFTTYPANIAQQGEEASIPVVSAGTKEVFLRGYRSGVPYESVHKTIDVFAPQPPQFAYTSDFEAPNSDFTGSLFRIGTEPGFVGSAIHSPHPYDDASSPTWLLTVPIQIAYSNSYIAFDEEALVEPGEPGSVFGDPAFYDYVVVEGSLDGMTWTPLAPGWDCRAYPEWETAFNANTPDPSLLRHRVIDLHDTYAWNDVVLIRFRLFADEGAHGWGWIIDNLDIQGESVAGITDDASIPVLQLAQNTPNPFRSRTSIDYSLARAGSASLQIFDVSGRLVRTLVDGVMPAGRGAVEWNGSDESGRPVAGGTYFARLVTDDQVRKRKLTVVR